MKKIPYKWIALSCSSLGALISVISGSTIIVAFPVIMKDLHTEMSIISWMMIGYMLTLTILVPCIGRIADMYGRKNLYVYGFFLFTLFSFLCGFAHSGEELLFYRILQAVGGALLVANSTTIVTDAFAKKEFGKALGINSMVISVASVVGPIIGGLIIPFGWRNIFFLNLPIGIIGTLWAYFQLKEVNTYKEKQKFDTVGTVTFSLGMLCLLMLLSFGGRLGWISIKALSLFVTGSLFLILFIYRQLTASHPMLDMRLLKNRFLAFAFLINLLNGIARGSISFLLIFYFQSIKGMDPLMASIVLTPFALAMMIVSPITGYLSDKYGERKLSSFGLLLTAIGFIGFMQITQETTILAIIFHMVIIGIGSGMFFSPNSSMIMGSVPGDKRGVAAGIRTMMSNIGTMVSISLSLGIISSSVAPTAMQNLMIGLPVDMGGIALEKFMASVRLVFSFSFTVSLLAAFFCFIKAKEPVWEGSVSTDAEKEKLL